MNNKRTNEKQQKNNYRKPVGVGLDQPAKNSRGIKLIALIITIILLLAIIYCSTNEKMRNKANIVFGKKMNYENNVAKVTEVNQNKRILEDCKEDLCFVAGTKVITPKGYVNIEELVVGDKVYTRNEETNETEVKSVLQTFETDYEGDLLKIYVDRSSVETTLNHKFYEKNKGWIRADELKIGDILVNNNNEEVRVIYIEEIKNTEIIKVYNLEVEDNHNYFVGFDCILVHNCCIDGDSLVLIDLEGTTKKIKELKKGDQVVTYNEETGENELTVVEKLIIKENAVDIVTVTFEDGTQIIQNMNHKILTKAGWKSLTNFYGEEVIGVGDEVKTKEGWKTIKEIDINLTHEPQDLYSIRTEKGNSFYANGIVMKID